MPRPTNKAALLETAKENFAKIWTLTENMPLHLQEAELPYNERDKTLRDVLVHLYEWQELLLAFVRTNLHKTGDFVPFLPAPYNFKTYPKMNKEIYLKHQNTPLKNAKAMLNESHTQCMNLIESLPQKELFVKKHYKWCGNTSLGSYCVSATSSHYDWAIKCIKKAIKNQ
ncbi:MAG: ClbS/DfsB family four-helix bundle protein [Helicobacter sp.]|nr:ClbS/DfsB family four-helix bundle protein [Helicobacter sp.]